MLWFWCMVVVRHLMMLSVDWAWWRLSMRWISGKVWRAIATAFLGGQALSLLLLLVGIEWHHQTPKAVLVACVTWHYFGAALLLVFAMPRVWCWASQWLKKGRQNEPAPSTPSPKGISRRNFISVSTALAPPLFNIGLTGVSLAQLSQFRVRRFTLPIPALPKGLDGTTIAHLSDVHVGPWTNGRVLRKIIESTNALRADLVVLTGDLIHYELADLSESLAFVKALESRHGLWMIEGNHDCADDGGDFERRVRAAGIPFLLDESAIATVRGCPVQLFGLRWIGAATGDEPGYADRLADLQMRRVLKRRHSEAFPILLAHHPHVFDVAAKLDLPLTLAGHTHGGQWMLDSQHGVGSALFRYWSGLYKRRESQMIVSNGVGNVLPLRINAPAEIVHITLRSS